MLSIIKLRHFYSYTGYNHKSLVLYNSRRHVCARCLGYIKAPNKSIYSQTHVDPYLDV